MQTEKRRTEEKTLKGRFALFYKAMYDGFSNLSFDATKEVLDENQISGQRKKEQ